MPAADEPEPRVGQTGARFGGARRRRRGGSGRWAGADVPGDAAAGRAGPAAPGSAPGLGAHADAAPGGDATTAGEVPVSEEEPAVGRTGARFAGATRAPRRAARPRPRPADGTPPDSAGTTKGDPERTARRDPGPVARPAAARGPEPAAAVFPDPVRDPAPDSADSAGAGWPAGPVARPYVPTAGRTRSAVDLPLEAMVSVAPTAPRVPVTAEQEAVLALCRQPRSVAEVAALLGLAVGVARVLVGDLAADGALVRHRTARPAGPDLDLLERVLAGLRRL